MSSVHPSQVPSLVTQMGYAPMIIAYDAEPSVRGDVFEMMTIQGFEEGFDSIDISGPVVPSEIERGQDSPHRTINEGYRRVFKVRKLAESITVQEEMLRNPNASAILGAMLSERMSAFGTGFQIAKETLAANVLNKGSLTAGSVPVFGGSHSGHVDPYPAFIYDGKPLFAATGNNHPLFFSTSTKFNKDSDALTSTNLESARIMMADTNAVNEAGERIRIDPNLLVVPPGLSRTAAVLINSTLLPATAQNDANLPGGGKTMQGQYVVKEWRYLTDNASGWFLGTAGKGIVCMDSGVPTISVSEADKSTGDITIRVTSYHGVGVKDWRYWSAHNTAGA